jgi:hypothetical protein
MMTPEEKAEQLASQLAAANADAFDNDETVGDIEVTDEEIDALKDEASVIHGGDQKEFAQNLLDQNAFRAIMQIVKLSTEATNERIRFDASKYVIERVLGPLSTIKPEVDVSKDPIYQLLDAVGLKGKGK